MDTSVLHNETQSIPELHLELDITAEKLAKRNDRAFNNTGYGATTGGIFLTTSYIDRIVPCVVAELTGNPHRTRSDAKKRQLEQVIRGLKPELIALVCLQGADSEEAAPWFRFDCAPGFQDDLGP